MTSGDAVEWIASMIFDITLEVRAANPAFDGHFKCSQLEGKTVNVKWYLRQEGVLDMTTPPTLDYYLVITGPWLSATLDTHNEAMGDVQQLVRVEEIDVVDQAQGVKIGIATGIRKDESNAAESTPARP